MKARIVPVYFQSEKDEEFVKQMRILQDLLGNEADFSEPVSLGSPLPEAEAVLFPQVVGDAYKKIEEIEKISLPILVVTSEFGTVNMWDWEVVSYLKSKSLQVFSPYTLEMTVNILNALAVKREMKETTFLVFQDNPGEGMQGSIFKRFYWWEDECTRLIQEKFGVTIAKKSFQNMAAEAKKIPDNEAEKVWDHWHNLPLQEVSHEALMSAIKVYMTLKKEIEADPSIKGAGINCLNESFFSDTTPCLAWNMLFEEKDLLWSCEADTLSLLTMFILYRTLKEPIMMSNIYPFLMGMAALKHEKIDHFPQVDEPENHLLVAHCGYLGVLPKCFSSQWSLRPKALEIVDDNATVIDARLPEGDVTLAKLDPSLSTLQLIEGVLEGYVQYPGSDCRNGALIKVSKGEGLMENLYSHHNILITGHHKVILRSAASILGLKMEVL